MTATTSPRKVSANQIKTTSVMRGWHVWNDYRGDVVVNAMQEDGLWTVTRKTDSDAPGVYSEVVASGLKTLAQVRAAIAAIYNGEDPQAVAQEAPARRKAPSALSPVEVGVKVGDFYYASWGYDQTQVQFYEVVALGAKSVKVREVAQHRLETEGPHDSVVPAAGHYIGEVETKVLRPYGEKGALAFSSYKSGYYWDGKPKYQTGQGYGH